MGVLGAVAGLFVAKKVIDSMQPAAAPEYTPPAPLQSEPTYSHPPIDTATGQIANSRRLAGSKKSLKLDDNYNEGGGALSTGLKL